MYLFKQLFLFTKRDVGGTGLMCGQGK